MTITPLNALELLPDGSDLEAVQIRLIKLDPPKPFGQGTIQSAFAEDSAGNKASVRFMDYDALTQDWVGPWMQIAATRNGKGDLTGLSVDSYNGKKRLNVKGTDQHGRNRTEITWLDGIPSAPASQPARQAAPPPRHAGPAHRDDIHYDTHPAQPPARQPGPPPRQAPPPPANRPAMAPAQAPARPAPPSGPHGATVGMVVKEAFNALLSGVSIQGRAEELQNPTFWRDVHACASELLHLCKALESGDIAPSCITASTPDFQAEEEAAKHETWEG